MLINYMNSLANCGSEVRNINDKMFIIELYLQFVIRYLNVYEYLESE
jgi:hypothetical protein